MFITLEMLMYPFEFFNELTSASKLSVNLMYISIDASGGNGGERWIELWVVNVFFFCVSQM